MKKIGAWHADRRPFSDVTPLVDHITVDDPHLGSQWRTRPLRDFNTRGWDKESYPWTTSSTSPRSRAADRARGLAGHRRRLLYVFANVGNTKCRSNSSTAVAWRNDPGNRPAAHDHDLRSGSDRPPAGGGWLGQTEMKLVMPARSFASVVIAKAGARCVGGGGERLRQWCTSMLP